MQRAGAPDVHAGELDKRSHGRAGRDDGAERRDLPRHGVAGASCQQHAGAGCRELAKRSGRAIPGDSQQRANRVQALGALAGIASGVAVGAAAGQLHGVIRRLGPVLGPALVGGAAMAATDVGMYRLGVTDPKTWDSTSWLSDAIPHLAYGVATWTLLPG